MSPTRIVAVHGRRVWDSRGLPTLEAELHLAGGAWGRAIAPAGASTGAGEVVDLRDGTAFLHGRDVRQALANINGEIARALMGRDAADQAAIDAQLAGLDGTPERRRLGGNALIAVSMAALHASANATGRPLWQHAAEGGPVSLPLPQIQIFGGGAHAARRVDIQDFLILCPKAASFAEALDWSARVYHAAGARLEAEGRRYGVADEGGWWPDFASNEAALEALVRAIEEAGLTPGDEVAIALDVAASQFGQGGRYRLGLEKRALDSDGLIDMLLGWLDRYPIRSFEDPLGEDDAEGFKRFTQAAGARAQIVGDDLLVTGAARVRAAAVDGLCNALLVKPNQAGTVTEARAAFDAARDAGFATVVSARSGESEDVTVAHLAVGWNAGQLKVGSFARSERMAKWNEVLRIEAALGAAAPFAGESVLRAGAARPNARTLALRDFSSD